MWLTEETESSKFLQTQLKSLRTQLKSLLTQLNPYGPYRDYQNPN